MELKDFSRLLKTAALEGADKALAQAGGLPDGLAKEEAYRLYAASSSTAGSPRV